jgi:hypothetical protein
MLILKSPRKYHYQILHLLGVYRYTLPWGSLSLGDDVASLGWRETGSELPIRLRMNIMRCTPGSVFTTLHFHRNL